MIEQFVSYNIALALKELGFDEECFGWSFVDSKTLHIEYISNQAEPYMVRPLWQQAIDWFRESPHFIQILEQPEIYTGDYPFYEVKERRVYITDEKYTLEQAILKAIEIVKKEKGYAQKM